MKTTRTKNLLAVTLVAALTLVCALDARAQSEESELPPARGEFEPAPLPPPEQPFFVPDVPQTWLEKFQMREHWMTLKVGLVTLADYTAFNQDTASIGQVGKQKDQWEARAARLMIRGTGQLFPMVELHAGRGLATSHRTGQRAQGP